MYRRTSARSFVRRAFSMPAAGRNLSSGQKESPARRYLATATTPRSTLQDGSRSPKPNIRDRRYLSTKMRRWLVAECEFDWLWRRKRTTARINIPTRHYLSLLCATFVEISRCLFYENTRLCSRLEGKQFLQTNNV